MTALSATAALLVLSGACLLAAHFGPYERRHPFVFLLGLALSVGGLSLVVPHRLERPGGLASLTLFIAFLAASFLHVRRRQQELAEEDEHRLQRLVREIADPGRGNDNDG